MKCNELRATFLEFFKERGHSVQPSDSLIPTADPSLLFTGAGMNQFKDEFLGKGRLEVKRVATSQKCVRTGDIENVGRTSSHHTFFEMLGNFSFGDYFKKEAIEYAWEFLLDVLKIPVEKLSVSVYKDDNDAYDIWLNDIGLPPERIYKFGEHDNFWPADAPSKSPSGTLCGPCSEIFYDWGTGTLDCTTEICDPSCDCGRFVEIWNLVFQQFEKGEKAGELHPLTNKNIDTGMGLERLTSILQGVRTNFEIDSLAPLVEMAADIADYKFGSENESDVRCRRIADHARAVIFMISDGVLPSNEGRGYVVRRLIRRALMDARRLGVSDPLLYTFVPKVVRLMGKQYQGIKERAEQITSFIRGEEERFGETLQTGLMQLEKFTAELKEGDQLDGHAVFTLYDTYGFPMELTGEIMSERGISIDEDGFKSEMEAARVRSKGATSESIFGFEFINQIKEKSTATKFVGYDNLECSSKIIALVKGEREEGRIVDELASHEGISQIVLEQTPFYGEAGGQVGDIGVIKTDSGNFEVSSTIRSGELFLHRGKVTSGTLKSSELATAIVNREHRLDIARNHTATHILQRVLREVLGKHVEQAGSLVEPTRLRLDFSHGKALTREELDAIEIEANRRVLEDANLSTKITSVEAARNEGAMALFGEKYGAEVRMVSVGDFSRELCGGTHINRSGEIGLIKIIAEESVAAGVRRITALTGNAAYLETKNNERVISTLNTKLKSNTADLTTRVDAIMGNVKKLERELAEAKKKALTGGGLDSLLEQKIEISGVNVLAVNVGEGKADDLRSMADVLRPKLAGTEGAMLVLAANASGKVSLLCCVEPKPLTKKLRAGDVVKKIAPIVGGGGGGRPDMAQAGGKDASKIDTALEAALDYARKILEGN